MTDPIVRVTDVTYRYPRTPAPALRNLDFQVQEGELIGIVGPTGAGKSTLIKAIMGELVLTSGSVVVGGGIQIGLDFPIA